MSRFTLPNGDWIDLTDRLNHAQRRRISASSDGATVDRVTEGVAAMATGWSLRGVDDEPIPFPGATLEGVPAEAFDAVPMDTFDLIAEHAVSLIAPPDPLGSAAMSNGSRPAPSSPSIPTSRTPTSSSTIRAGRGTPSDPPLPI